jgi:hypothetical protein
MLTLCLIQDVFALVYKLNTPRNHALTFLGVIPILGP